MTVFYFLSYNVKPILSKILVIRLEKSSGLADFVVWNPWAAGAAKMADMDDEEWKHFVCVEAAQTSKIIHIKASGDKDKVWKASHVLTLTDANTATGKGFFF